MRFGSGRDAVVATLQMAWDVDLVEAIQGYRDAQLVDLLFFWFDDAAERWEALPIKQVWLAQHASGEREVSLVDAAGIVYGGMCARPRPKPPLSRLVATVQRQ
jgi:hypothetical protein